MLTFLLYRKVPQSGFIQRAIGEKRGLKTEIYYYGKTESETVENFKKVLACERTRGFKPHRFTTVAPHTSYCLVPRKWFTKIGGLFNGPKR